MSAPKQPRPSFGALIHGADAPTEVFVGQPGRGHSQPAPSAYDQTVATERIRPPASRAPGAPDAAGPYAAQEAEPAEPEKVIARFRSHGRRLFFPTIFVIAVAGATGYFSGWFAEEWQNWGVLAAGSLLAVLFFLVPAVRWLCTRYTITSRRIVFRRGLLVNTRSELMLTRAHDVTVRKSVLQAMFRSGDVRISTGSGEFAVLKDVPRADLVAAVLGDLLEERHEPAHAVRFRRPDQNNPWWDEQQPGRPE